MFKKTLLAVLLLSMIAGCTTIEESENESESEETSLITQCDEQYNECAEKCGDPASEICIQKCDEISKQCYARAPLESEDGSSEQD